MADAQQKYIGKRNLFHCCYPSSLCSNSIAQTLTIAFSAQTIPHLSSFCLHRSHHAGHPLTVDNSSLRSMFCKEWSCFLRLSLTNQQFSIFLDHFCIISFRNIYDHWRVSLLIIDVHLVSLVSAQKLRCSSLARLGLQLSWLGSAREISAWTHH